MLKLLHGDCVDTLSEIRSDSVDLTVTSPPYDNIRIYNGVLDWNEDVWRAVLKQLYRVTKVGGVVVWIVADATIKGSETGSSFRQALHAMECGFNLHDTMIWQKDSVPYPASSKSNRYTGIFEYMFVFSREKPKTAVLIKDLKNKNTKQESYWSRRDRHGNLVRGIHRPSGPYRYRNNIWYCATGGSKSYEERYVRDHPCVFPEKLVHDHVITWSERGDTILDPFMGSGTTGKIAVRTGRNFIGIERDRQYFELARRRIYENVPALQSA